MKPLPRLSDLRFAFGLLLPAISLHGVLVRPEKAAWGALVVWLLIAAGEAFWPALARSPAASPPGSRARWFLRLYVPLQMVLLAFALRAAAVGDWPTILGLAFSVGFVTGAQGISYAHELGHSRQRADRALAWTLMGSVAYPQFMVEHYRGHHVRAATWDDPASARAGETLWRFLPRTLWGSLRSAWELEAARLAQRRRTWWTSPLLWWTFAGLMFVVALAGAGGWKMAAFWLLQSAFAVWLLETVNYVEHYGLQRRTGSDGRPEPFGVAHAWNADHVVSNSLLANLQRHSDHHMHAWKSFPELQPLPGPQLPTGYAGCLLLAAVPAAWFAVMHPRLAAERRGSALRALTADLTETATPRLP